MVSRIAALSLSENQFLQHQLDPQIHPFMLWQAEENPSTPWALVTGFPLFLESVLFQQWHSLFIPTNSRTLSARQVS